MRFGFATRLSAVLALAGCLTAGLTGGYVYRISHQLLEQDAQSQLLTATAVVNQRIEALEASIGQGLGLLAHHPASLEVLKARSPQAADALATLFELMMAHNPAYYQIRLISADDHGLERVRVDRDKARLLRVNGDDLQEKGFFPYVSDTLKLSDGNIYQSPIVINHELGAHSALDLPTARFAMPVIDATQRAIGVVVINVDLNHTFQTLTNDLPRDFRLFVTNREGDYLIHPDPTLTFGFDRGQRVLLQEDLPAAAGLVNGETARVVVKADQGRYAQTPLVIAFERDDNRTLYGASTLLLGVGQPLQHVLARADALGHDILMIVGGVGVAGILLAIWLARYVTRPINTLSRTVQDFSRDHDTEALPVQRKDEIGQLARNFLALQAQIRQQFTELQRSHAEMERLALHDTLTGLPNRRLFLERLQHAIERARRSSQTLALLFIDLDKFKDINDRHGHEAGDTVLREVGARLRQGTRESDTVARLAGDEFVVLLENVANPDSVAGVAAKLAQSVAEPLAYSGQMLSIRMSVGVALFPRDGDTLDGLINHADQAMYQAKADPRQRIHFAEPS